MLPPSVAVERFLTVKLPSEAFDDADGTHRSQSARDAGKPVIRATRIPVEPILRKLREGLRARI